MRVLSVHGMAERGGSDQALLRMVRTLPTDRFSVTVAVPAQHPLEQELTSAGAALHVVPMRRISTSHSPLAWLAYAAAWPVTVLRLVRLIRHTGADVVHTNSLHFWHGWAAAAITRRPHVWHAREVVVQSGPALALERWLTRRFATLVVAMSASIAEQLDAPSVVVHEHPDPAEFTPTRAGRWREDLGLPDAAPVLGVVGRVDTWKGFDVALDAFVLVREQLPDARLVLTGVPVRGKADYARGLQERAAGTPGTCWTGPRRDVPDLFADLDVLLVPSTSPEPYGLVVVEALASGCPVVASAAGGPVEILAAAEPGAGALVPSGDAAAFAAATVELLQRRAVGTHARRQRSALNRPTPAPFGHLLAEVAHGGRRYRGQIPELTERT